MNRKFLKLSVTAGLQRKTEEVSRAGRSLELKAFFAVVAVIAAVMFMGTAVFAAAPVFIEQPQDVYIAYSDYGTVECDGYVSFKLDTTYATSEIWEYSGACISKNGGSSACPIVDAIGKTCFIRAYNSAGTEYTDSDTFTVTSALSILEQPHCVIESATEQYIYYKLSFKPYDIVVYDEYGKVLTSTSDSTRIPINENTKGKNCYIQFYYKQGYYTYLKSETFKVDSDYAFIHAPQSAITSTPIGNTVYYELNFEPLMVGLYTEAGTFLADAGETSCSMDDVLGQTCVIRAYYGSTYGYYVTSPPFKVEYFDFIEQPKSIEGSIRKLKFKTGFVPSLVSCIRCDTDEAVDNQSGNSYGIFNFDAAKVGVQYYLRAYYGYEEYVDSEPFYFDFRFIEEPAYNPKQHLITFKTSFDPLGATELWEVGGTNYIAQGGSGGCTADGAEGKMCFIRVHSYFGDYLDSQPFYVGEYTVTFDPNGGSGTMDPIKAVTGTEVTLPKCPFTPPDDDSVFIYWSINGNYIKAGYKYTVTSNIVVKAVWGRKRIAQFLDSSSQEIEHIYVGEGEELTMPDYNGTVPTGKQFAYWVHNKDVSEENPYYPGDEVTVNEDMTFLSKFETKECKVTFDTGGIGSAPPVQTVLYNNKASYPAVNAINGYIVSGWYTDEDRTENFDFDTVIKGDITLYAKWEEADNKITVDGNEKTVMLYFGDDIEFEFSDSTAPTDNYYKLWFTYIPKGETKTTTKLIKGNLPVVYSSTDENYSVILNPSNTSIIAKLGAGLYATNANAVPINLIVKYKQGDLNKNGSLDEEDAAIMLKYISGSIQLDETQLEIADANSDGRKDMLDVIAILNMAS